MKRFLWRLLALAALAAASVAPAVAGPHWFTKEVQWRGVPRFESATSTVPVRPDTAYRVLGNATADPDTSKWFTLDGLWEPKGGYSAIADSIIVAYVVIVSDTTAQYTATLTSLTPIIDAGWVSGAAVSGSANIIAVSDQLVSPIIAGGAKLVTTGNKVVAIPLSFGQMPPNSINTNVGLLQFAPLRLRITTATGSLGSARIFVAYQRDEQQKP